MFTGIIEETGTVESLTPTGNGSAILTLRAGAVLDGLPEGGSLAVNGVCLTQDPDAATQPGDSAGLFRAHVMGETLDRTTAGSLRAGDTVNLERCPRAGDRLDGHIVQGHVDGTGEVLEKVDEGDWIRLRVSVPAALAPYAAEKGSIALDGISLTLTAVSPAPGAAHLSASTAAGEPAAAPSGTVSADHWVEVGLIPATLEATRMGSIRPGDPVNIEVDVMAKYAARLAEFHAAPTSSREGEA